MTDEPANLDAADRPFDPGTGEYEARAQVRPRRRWWRMRFWSAVILVVETVLITLALDWLGITDWVLDKAPWLLVVFYAGVAFLWWKWP